ncbi:hypothetical protein GY45DRAFT_1375369 [Cubamyces sp. BRFM 1775]|nr:hypothetical protein GY45DRAFT_1375369 [Cubamyces sp. BRFM 1775]
MPRRTATPATPAPPAPLPPPPRDPATLAESDPQWAANLATLRRHWKWANFSQFFYTFAPLLAIPDVFLSDIEDDLARGTNLFLPRVMHRLLYTLSQDRKITIDNWQSALRRQYLRRAPELNPIGPEPKVPSRESSIAPSEPAEEDTKVNTDADTKPTDDAENVNTEQADVKETLSEDAELRGESSNTKLEPHEDSKVPSKANSEQPRLKTEEQEESKDWLELPMLAKLNSLQLLTDWQFHNPYRVRQIMKDDDDAANWRIEPIGYDAKTNAYWLIGPDRLWIQRVPPKPPRTRKRKRPAPTPKKASTSKAAAVESSDTDDEPVTRSKRTRTQSNAAKSSSQVHSRAQANGRATRASRRQTRASSPAPELSSPGKSTRAAKVQANKKLDMQAKELAEFQRQAAREAKAHASPRAARRAPPSPAKRAVGTRVSARLRRSTRGAADEDGDDDDAEWQEVPDEWLQGDENPSPSRRSSARMRATKGKAKAVEEDEDEDEAEAEEAEAEEADADGDTDADGEKDARVDEKGAGDVAGAGAGAGSGDAHGHELLQKAGLESDAESDLTDLSEDPQKPDQEEDIQMAEPEDDDNDASETPAPAKSRNARTRARKSTGGGGGGRRKSARQTRRAPPRAKMAVPKEADVQPSAQEEEPREDEPPHADVDDDEPAAPELPADFVEWEAIAVTLPEWEHVADRFANATHYLEKALYKTLTQHIVPVVTAELREHEKRRRMEEAIVHRKRSSRIALKESEKEEARLAAKKRAEEEEKMARAKRQEARLKKEEAERAKRERAREQRAKEREEREARARAKAERAESKGVDTSVARSTATPTVNGTQPSSSVQPSRVVTPNGVRSPDWVLDCEVCHKQGVNVDDGLPMVSCGSCNRWQHIPCHDLNDQRSGRSRRNWEEQQFYCSRCRARATNGGGSAYGSHAQGYPAPSQYSWSQAARTGAVHKPMGVDPYAQTSDLRYSHRSPLENGPGYPQQQQYSANHVGAASYSRPSYPNNGFSFPHYQSDQRGMPSRGAPLPPSHSSGWGNGNGYSPSSADLLNGRMQSAQFAPQYTHAGGAYTNNRIPSTYQNSSPTFSTHDAPSMSAARWPSTSTNGYHPSPSTGNAVQTAAESLAFMHDTGSRYNGGSSAWPAQQQSYSHSHGQPSSMPSFSQSGHASQHGGRSSYPGQSQLSPVDPLASHAYPAPRAEQHVGSSLPSGGGSSFNFPS